VAHDLGDQNRLHAAPQLLGHEREAEEVWVDSTALAQHIAAELAQPLLDAARAEGLVLAGAAAGAPSLLSPPP
jgi:hypothetical protein